MRTLRTLAAVAVLASSAVPVMAQDDGLLVYEASRTSVRPAEASRIDFMEGAVAGRMEAIIPDDAERVDLLNGRGNVKHTYSPEEFGQIGLGGLRPGTWTLRVQHRGGMAVRRFVVNERGALVWMPEPAPIQRRRVSR